MYYSSASTKEKLRNLAHLLGSNGQQPAIKSKIEFTNFTKVLSRSSNNRRPESNKRIRIKKILSRHKIGSKMSTCKIANHHSNSLVGMTQADKNSFITVANPQNTEYGPNYHHDNLISYMGKYSNYSTNKIINQSQQIIRECYLNSDSTLCNARNECVAMMKSRKYILQQKIKWKEHAKHIDHEELSRQSGTAYSSSIDLKKYYSKGFQKSLTIYKSVMKDDKAISSCMHHAHVPYRYHNVH